METAGFSLPGRLVLRKNPSKLKGGRDFLHKEAPGDCRQNTTASCSVESETETQDPE